MSDVPKCELCGDPMPPGEEMFKFHGYSGDCPKPPLAKNRPTWVDEAAKECADQAECSYDPNVISSKFAEIIQRHYAAK